MSAGVGPTSVTSPSGLTERRSGTMPSQRQARRTGPAAGSTPPTQTGMRGCCTGTGLNRTGSSVKCAPW